MSYWHLAFIFWTLVGGLAAWAPAPAPASPPPTWQATVDLYRQSSGTMISFTKSVKSVLLDKETSLEGKLYLYKDKFRVDMDSLRDSKDRITWDGSTLWIENTPKQGPVQVSQLQKKKHPLLLLQLLSSSKAWGQVVIVKQKKQGTHRVYHLKSAGLIEGVSDIVVEIDAGLHKLSKISYKDPLGNEVSYSVKYTRVNRSFSSGLFKYQPPKGVSVLSL